AIVDSLQGALTTQINLIGSATLPFPEVCEAEGLPGTSCRVEGHPGARLFPATEPYDLAESLIDERLRALFGLDESYAITAQPHSATQANHAVYRAVLPEAGGTVAALGTTDGGHISHRLGLPRETVFLAFPVGPDGIDYDALAQLCDRHRPDLVIGGGTSYPLAVDYPRLGEIARATGAHLHADLAHTAPFVAGGLHEPAFPD
ncbi:hypothetical protein B7486_73250, partial [cyanobacterium TDX16]